MFFLARMTQVNKFLMA